MTAYGFYLAYGDLSYHDQVWPGLPEAHGLRPAAYGLRPAQAHHRVFGGDEAGHAATGPSQSQKVEILRDHNDIYAKDKGLHTAADAEGGMGTHNFEFERLVQQFLRERFQIPFY